jgi:hypothetical protein
VAAASGGGHGIRLLLVNGVLQSLARLEFGFPFAPSFSHFILARCLPFGEMSFLRGSFSWAIYFSEIIYEFRFSFEKLLSDYSRNLFFAL